MNGAQRYSIVLPLKNTLVVLHGRDETILPVRAIG